MQHRQYLCRFRSRLKHGFDIAAGKFLIPVGDIGGGIRFRHGQRKMRAGQHGKHFRAHFFKGVALDGLRIFQLTVFPRFVPGGMEELVQFGGVIFIRTAEPFGIRQGHLVFFHVEAGIAAVVPDVNAGAGDEAFHHLMPFNLRHGMGGTLLGGESLNLGGIEDRERIEKRFALNVGNVLPPVLHFLDAPEFFLSQEFPGSVFFHNVGDFLRSQHLDAPFALADVHLQFGVGVLKALKLVEGHPPVIGVSPDNGCQQQPNQVRPAVLSAGHGTERHSHRRVGGPAPLPIPGFFRQGKHGFSDAVDELFLDFSAYLKAVFSFARLLTHAFSSRSSTMTESCSSCGLRKPARTASFLLIRKAPASSCRSICRGVRFTRSFSWERTGESKRPKLLRGTSFMSNSFRVVELPAASFAPEGFGVSGLPASAHERRAYRPETGKRRHAGALNKEQGHNAQAGNGRRPPGPVEQPQSQGKDGTGIQNENFRRETGIPPENFTVHEVSSRARAWDGLFCLALRSARMA